MKIIHIVLSTGSCPSRCFSGHIYIWCAFCNSMSWMYFCINITYFYNLIFDNSITVSFHECLIYLFSPQLVVSNIFRQSLVMCVWWSSHKNSNSLGFRELQGCWTCGGAGRMACLERVWVLWDASHTPCPVHLLPLEVHLSFGIPVW